MHQPVMVEAVLRLLAPSGKSLFIDGTLGGAGHAGAVLSAAGPGARLLGVDRDPARLRQAEASLAPFGDRVRLVHGRFSEIDRFAGPGWKKVDGILLDLGISSDQVDDPARGFSFRADGPLDMRMDPGEGLSAADLLAKASEEEIADILYRYGEERRSRRIARAICRERAREPAFRTGDLARIVERALGGRRGARIHPATRTFQALRIAVNGELAEIEEGLPRLWKRLAHGGRIAVISFHSLEDRIVKTFFRRKAAAGRGTVLTRKPERPDAAEIAVNPRARSAKLRAAERR